MHFRDVNIPSEILDAQVNDSLVIFAGAGVSMGPPSNLPSFKGLAAQIAEHTEEMDPDDEKNLDRFLGRLKSNGLDVHGRAHRILSNPASSPTVLHRDLVRLFAKKSIRIITTNFDSHFNDVATELYGEKVPIYHAPALPLGRQFSGIVYIHGSLAQPPENLVLTDIDFGKAYLRDAWATRFLTEAFKKYTVLFVGYSHSDPVMHYFGRAMAGDSIRFALTNSSEDGLWTGLGIEAIKYPQDDSKDHSFLYRAISAWAEQTNRGFLDHADRLRRILSEPPTSDTETDPETNDYLSNCLCAVETTRAFCRYATDVKWLVWAARQSPFKEIFDGQWNWGTQHEFMSGWFAGFCISHPNVALQVLLANGSH
ncbi:MAG: SIR2 family protein, partial [Bdellovibrionota bacterium]